MNINKNEYPNNVLLEGQRKTIEEKIYFDYGGKLYSYEQLVVDLCKLQPEYMMKEYMVKGVNIRLLKHMKDEGKGWKEITECLGRSESYLREVYNDICQEKPKHKSTKVIQKTNITKLTDGEKDEMVRLCMGGLNDYEIAEKVNRSRSSVWRTLKPYREFMQN